MSPCKGGNCPEPVWCEQEGECLWDRWNKPAAKSEALSEDQRIEDCDECPFNCELGTKADEVDHEEEADE